MSEYTLNDIEFTQGPVDELPLDASKNTQWDIETINRQSQDNWAKLEQYERDFEERTKDLVVDGLLGQG